MAEVVEVVGLPELQASLGRLSRELPDLAPPGAVTVIGREAQMRAPKRTGRLAGSFGAGQSGGVQTLSFGAVYAPVIHWGTGPRSGLRGPHNIRPSLFLTGAIEDTEAQWLGEYEAGLQDLVDNVKGA